MREKAKLLARMQASISQLEKHGNCYVKSGDICTFVDICETLEIRINGGAFVLSNGAVSGQYFYI